MSVNLRKLFSILIGGIFLILLVKYSPFQLTNQPLQITGEVRSSSLFSPLPTTTNTPQTLPTPLTPENTPYSIPPATLVPNPEPTATSEPYVGLVVDKIEPVANGPYLNMLWSPDGTKALISKKVSLYVLARSKNSDARTDMSTSDLWLLDSTTNSEKLLLSRVGRYAWSPDSTKLILLNPTQEEGIAGRLTIYDLTTGESKDLTDADFLGGDYAPHWLPDDAIVYVHDGLLWSIQADGSKQQRLANFSFFSRFVSWENKKLDDPQQVDIGGFHFSPNGKRIAYKTSHNNIRVLAYKLWIADIDGNHAQLITGQAEGGYYEWSPDSNWLLFNTFRDIDDPILDEHGPSTRGLWIVQQDGSNARPLYRADNWRWIISPIWSPDSKRVAFTQWEFQEGQNTRTEIWLADVNPILQTAPQTAPLANPSDRQDGVYGVWWAPDGMTLWSTANRFDTNPLDYHYESDQISLAQK